MVKKKWKYVKKKSAKQLKRMSIYAVQKYWDARSNQADYYQTLRDIRKKERTKRRKK